MQSMFQDEVTPSRLVEKVTDLLQRYEDLKEQNEKMRQELVTLKAQNEVKDTQIAKLEEEMMNKDVETEDILGKIEEVLRK